MSDEIKCPKAGFWYHRYWNELKMSTVNRITLADLCQSSWSLGFWFLRPNRVLLPSYVGSGLKRPKVNGFRFGVDGSFARLNGIRDVVLRDLYALLENGTIVNTTWEGIESRSSRCTLRVHRRLDWELRSQYYVLRSYDEKGPDGLWEDYLQNMVMQRKEDGTPPNVRPGFEDVVVRAIPSQMADKLVW